jgi:putative N6-adenine-specific DNA methylase
VQHDDLRTVVDVAAGVGGRPVAGIGYNSGSHRFAPRCGGTPAANAAGLAARAGVGAPFAVMTDMDIFAVTVPGLEAVCAAELSGLGIAGELVDGGVAWRGDLRSVYRANLCSRTASRVLVRVGEFRARTFAELERHAGRLPWSRFLEPGAAVALRVTARKSRLYHTGAVAERIGRVLATEAGVVASVAKRDDEEDDDVAQSLLFVVRFLRDVCTVSVDASGALLHQRGYRQALAKAPLRETLAAALLLASGWRGDTALIDPLCGSGALPIEAALLARSIAPGLANAELRPRSYAFESWPGFDGALRDDVVAAARAVVRPAAGVPILGSDRNAGAIAASVANAARAGVEADVEFMQRPLAELQPPAGLDGGHLVTNPPYGVRVGEAAELSALYAELGTVARVRLSGWTVALIAAEQRLASATGLPLRELLATRNGGIPVRFLAATA